MKIALGIDLERRGRLGNILNESDTPKWSYIRTKHICSASCVVSRYRIFIWILDALDVVGSFHIYCNGFDRAKFSIAIKSYMGCIRFQTGDI